MCYPTFKMGNVKCRTLYNWTIYTEHPRTHIFVLVYLLSPLEVLRSAVYWFYVLTHWFFFLLLHSWKVFAQIRVQQYKAFGASHTHTDTFESAQKQRIIRLPSNIELFVRKIVISPKIRTHLHFNSYVKMPPRRITTCSLWNKIARLQTACSVTWYVDFTKALFFFYAVRFHGARVNAIYTFTPMVFCADF